MFRSGIEALKRRARKVPLLVALRAATRPAPIPLTSGPEVIAAYVQALPPGGELKVVFGGHWSDHPGWLLLNEQQQDVTKRLSFADNSIDVVFAEHVIEHLPFAGAVGFLQESFRALKPVGVCRILCPMLDRMMTADFSDANGRENVRNSLLPYFASEHAILSGTLKLDGLNADPMAFLFNGTYMGHGHRFIWTTGLMIKVMTAIGFRSARRYGPGEGSRPADCIERRQRGLYMGWDWREDRAAGNEPHDLESLAVEAIK